MKFVIAVYAAPHAPASRRALKFAEATLSSGHEIVRLFFYQDGVHNACNSITPPQDEINLAHEWSSFIEAHKLDAVVCIAAALRRGVLDQQEAERHGTVAACVEPPWDLSGLGQLHEAIQSADRLISFGGH